MKSIMPHVLRKNGNCDNLSQRTPNESQHRAPKRNQPNPNDCPKNMSEVVQKVVKEEVEKMQRKTGQVNTGWGGAGGRRAAVVRTVRP